MKRFISIILASMLLLSVIPFAAFAANGATEPAISIEISGDVCPGGKITLTVNAKTDIAYQGGEFVLDLPAGFTVDSYTCSASVQGIYGNSTKRFAWIAIPATALDGVLFTAEVSVDQTVAPGTQPVFGIVSASFAENYNATPVTPNQTGSNAGSVTVVACADANKDHLCDTCGKTLSDCVDANDDNICDICRQPICHHVPGTPVQENYVGTSCAAEGSYDTVTYCTLCDKELERITTPIPQLPHTDDNNDNYCDDCGAYIHACTVTSKMPISKIPATCKEYGCINYLIYCVKCNKPLAFSTTLITVLADHADEDLDGKCDVCEKVVGEVEPEEPEHVHELVHTEAKEATCFEEGNLEYWYCAGCDCYFTDAEGKYNTARLSMVTPVAHKVEHVVAVEPTATENGNIEYWYCTACGYAWLDEFCTKNTNLKAVILPATGEPEHVHELVHTEAKAATCFEEGNLEYWYCAGCDCYFTDAEGKYNTARLSMVTPVTHKVEYVAAVAPTATENGNIEYWFCTECGYAWLDELCTKNTNLKAVILPATGEVINPPTGDNAIFYVVALAVIATLGVAVVSFKKREEN